MKLGHLTNKSATTLYNELLASFEKAREFSIATAFVNDEAIELIAASLKKNKKLHGRLLTGLYSCFNKKKDLERLLELANKYPDRMQVHISLDRCFHWKYYHFISGQKQTFYIGSANFTTGGMVDNRELVVKLSDKIKTADYSSQNLAKSFEKEWLHSRLLEEFPLEHYSEAKQPTAPAGGVHQKIKDFFSKETETAVAVNDNGKAYAIQLAADAKPSTYKVVANKKSEWIKNGWDWFILPTRRAFDICKEQKFAFIFSHEGRDNVWCYFSEIMDNDPNLPTEDGTYFIAYRVLKQVQLSREQRVKLRAKPFNIDLIGWKNPFCCKLIGKANTAAIIDFLRLKR